MQDAILRALAGGAPDNATLIVALCRPPDPLIARCPAIVGDHLPPPCCIPEAGHADCLDHPALCGLPHAVSTVRECGA